MNFVIIFINTYLLYGLELFLCCNLYDEYLNKWMFYVLITERSTIVLDGTFDYRLVYPNIDIQFNIFWTFFFCLFLLVKVDYDNFYVFYLFSGDNRTHSKSDVRFCSITEPNRTIDVRLTFGSILFD